MAATGREVVSAVADKIGTTDELLLVHLSSAGGKTTEFFSLSMGKRSSSTLPIDNTNQPFHWHPVDEKSSTTDAYC